MRIFRKICCFTVLLAALSDLAHGAGDPKRGAQIFQACAACHSVKPGEHMTGPSLTKIWNQKAAIAEGFSRYSEPLKHANLVWDEDTLDRWLAHPDKLVPGTSMTFSGISDPRSRQDLIAYLKAVSEGSAPVAEQKGRGMPMTPGKLDLRRAPPEAQVASIRYCGDTYTVQMAEGKTERIWEFNLRFKTDSSKLGPLPGRPIAVGAGMQGDRASVVFSSPGEISEFIKRSCS